MTTCLCLHPGPELTISGQTVYCQTEEGVTGCKFSGIVTKKEDLIQAVTTLAARTPALIVLKGCRAPTTTEAWTTVLRTAWDQVSGQGSRPVAYGVRTVTGTVVMDVTEKDQRKVDFPVPLRQASTADFLTSLDSLTQYIIREYSNSHIVVHFERSCKPAFLTSASNGLTAVWLACPDSAPTRDIQLFE